MKQSYSFLPRQLLVGVPRGPNEVIIIIIKGVPGTLASFTFFPYR